MRHAPSATETPGPDFPFVDRFLESEAAAHALTFALASGLIDRLARRSEAAAAGLADEFRLDPPQYACLTGLLIGAGIAAEPAPGRIALSEAFRAVLPCRDLIEAKLAFAAAASEDLRRHFSAFVADLPAFMAASRTFELFRYDRCFAITPENLDATRRWVAYTTCLTRYEAGPCLDRIEPGRHRHLLDLGGNSGEFAAQACRRVPSLTATVLDLPVVCALGRDNLAGRPEGTRVAFRPGDMRRDPLPEGHDLITFKSVLHDWPAIEARALLERATRALMPGGRLVIYERAPVPLRARALGYVQSADLVFQPFFRDAGFYAETLEALGFVDGRVRTIALETPFHLIEARKPDGAP
ncbi:type 12 methyltransferase [Methylorubrum populi]|uniref:Type 12 methyltransferase n=1 Tax=Methylorubrum populi TaxID=223967 RepID=A0A169R1U9_9HYPH|nr:methyltransferase [Methylorubrum populi]BAU91122.1 type 12 methyltransferase [Methylorubrum populi]